jgi:hypothetical protein
MARVFHGFLYVVLLGAWVGMNENTVNKLVTKASVVFTPSVSNETPEAVRNGLMRSYYLLLIQLFVFFLPSSTIHATLGNAFTNFLVPVMLTAAFFFLDASVALWDALDDGKMTQYDQMQEQELMLISLFNFVLVIANTRLYRKTQMHSTAMTHIHDTEDTVMLLTQILVQQAKKQSEAVSEVTVADDAESLTKTLSRTKSARTSWAEKMFQVMDSDRNGAISRKEIYEYLMKSNEATFVADQPFDKKQLCMELLQLEAKEAAGDGALSLEDFVTFVRQSSMNWIAK